MAHLQISTLESHIGEAQFKFHIAAHTYVYVDFCIHEALGASLQRSRPTTRCLCLCLPRFPMFMFIFMSLCVLNLKNPAGANFLEVMRMTGKTNRFKMEVQSYVENEKKAWMSQAQRAMAVTYLLNPA